MDGRLLFGEKRTTDPLETGGERGWGGVYIKVSLVKAVIDGDVAALQASRLAKGQGTSYFADLGKRGGRGGGVVGGGTRFPRLRPPLGKEQYLCLKMRMGRAVVAAEVRPMVYCYW